MTGPLVSIALCTYNGDQFLDEQLQSLLAQTYPNLEIVVVDDASNDKTAVFVESWSSRNKKVRLVKRTPPSSGI